MDFNLLWDGLKHLEASLGRLWDEKAISAIQVKIQAVEVEMFLCQTKHRVA